MPTLLTVVVAFALGWGLWVWAEYMLHRFAMHHLHGKGIMSREHLEHHVAHGWTFSSTHLLSWTGMLLVGAAVWAPIAWWLSGTTAAVAVAVGWAFGYFFYEYHHAMAHLRAPRTRYQRQLRKHHFHHHFGAPMTNHGVTVGFWDHVFRTHHAPARVRVPRRHAQAWMLDDDGELRPEHAEDYELVGSLDRDERWAKIDRARAFASVAPEA